MQTPHVFGEYQHLFGIHRDAVESEALDSESSCSESKIAVLMLTAGMLTSVGPSRLHVDLADKLSGLGLPSFRFDLSGIGESLAVGSHGSSLERAASEVRQAMDMLEREYGYSHFMLFGLCSGADDAIPSAVEDERIIAASLVDACGYRTAGHWAPFVSRKYLPKVVRMSKWIDLFRGYFQSTKSSASTMPIGSDIREFPDREQSEATLLGLIGRGMRLQFVYTGGVIDYYSYADQFFDMFPRVVNRSEIAVVYQPRWDHVAMLQEDRTELLQAVVSWFDKTAEAFRKETLVDRASQICSATSN
ncbi:MAG: lipase [Pirellula sp.]|jgi:hypothetical protein|nr:lipase [Pirellula sp.]